eukprot:jgi/Picsp_1/193/NSC_00192-R1_---NA---
MWPFPHCFSFGWGKLMVIVLLSLTRLIHVEAISVSLEGGVEERARACSGYPTSATLTKSNGLARRRRMPRTITAMPRSRIKTSRESKTRAGLDCVNAIAKAQLWGLTHRNAKPRDLGQAWTPIPYKLPTSLAV